MLEEDDQKIHDFLNQVCDRLQNAPRNASIQVLQRFKYFYVNNMIEYFQMETRRQLRRLLIEAFLLMCSLDANIILLMLSSVLPLELVQDIYQTKVRLFFPMIIPYNCTGDIFLLCHEEKIDFTFNFLLFWCRKIYWWVMRCNVWKNLTQCSIGAHKKN